MSMPSDVTADITEAVEKITPKALGKPSKMLTRDQAGLALAAVVAFIGVAFAGPALGRALDKQRRLEDRIASRARDARVRARKAGRRVQKKVRRLGDQTFGR